MVADKYQQNNKRAPRKIRIERDCQMKPAIMSHLIRSSCGSKRLLGRTEQSRQASAEKAGTHAAIGNNTVGVISTTT